MRCDLGHSDHLAAVGSLADLCQALSGFFGVAVLLHDADFILSGIGVPRSGRPKWIPLLRRRFEHRTAQRLSEGIRAQRLESGEGGLPPPVTIAVAPGIEEHVNPFWAADGTAGYLSWLGSGVGYAFKDERAWTETVSVVAAGYGTLKRMHLLGHHAASPALMEILKGATTGTADAQAQRLLAREGTVILASLFRNHPEAIENQSPTALVRDAARWMRLRDPQGVFAVDDDRRLYLANRSQGERATPKTVAEQPRVCSRRTCFSPLSGRDRIKTVSPPRQPASPADSTTSQRILLSTFTRSG